MAPGALREVSAALERVFWAPAIAYARHADLHARLIDPAAPIAERLDAAIEGLNRRELVVVIDRFEEVLEVETGRFADPVLARGCRQLAQRLVRGSRVLVASRYRPVRPARRGARAARRLPRPRGAQAPAPRHPRPGALHGGELPRDRFDRLCRELSGTPGCLEVARVELRTVGADAEREVLRWVSLALAQRLAANGALTSARDVITTLPEPDRGEALGDAAAARDKLMKEVAIHRGGADRASASRLPKRSRGCNPRALRRSEPRSPSPRPRSVRWPRGAIRTRTARAPKRATT